MPPHVPSDLPKDPAGAFDARMMHRAIALARKGQGLVEPNPMVGCVLVKNDTVIGEGWHRRFGGPHAETNALRSCKGDPKGATAYVSLEPCCHHGKTPPCADALIEAAVGRIVFAVHDPHRPQGKGGQEVLRRARIVVHAGIEADAARELIAPYLTRHTQKRPYVIAKWAQSLDGKLATRTGDSQWISSDASRRLVHRLRARVDAIMVGSQTVIADDPRLTARDVRVRRRAARVVLDTRLRTAAASQLVQTAREIPTILFTATDRAGSTKARRLQKQGVEVIPCRLQRNRVSLRSILSTLARRDVTNLLVEGGPTLLSALLEKNLVDEAHVFTAPFLIGGDGAPSALGGRGPGALSAAPRPVSRTIRRSGDDVLHILRLTDPPT